MTFEPGQVLYVLTLIDEGLEMLRETKCDRGARSGPSSSVEPAAPVDLGKLGHIHEIEAQVTGWARLTEEETGDLVAHDDTVMLYLRRHVMHIVNAEWCYDMMEELRVSAAKARAMAEHGGASRVESPCECGAEQWVYAGPPAYVRCKWGHKAELVDYAYARDEAEYTVSQVARLVGVTDGAVRKAIERDLLAARMDGVRWMIPAGAVKSWRERA